MRITFSIPVKNISSQVSFQKSGTYTAMPSFTKPALQTPANKTFLSPRQKKPVITLKTQDGRYIQGKIIQTAKNTFAIMLDNEDSAGTMFVSESGAPINGIPNSYKSKKYLFINHIKTNSTYKNAGKVLIQSAIKESKKRGFEGRVCLNASTTDPERGSPVGFYYSQGFKSTRPELNKLLETYDRIPNNTSSTTMYYDIK